VHDGSAGFGKKKIVITGYEKRYTHSDERR